MESHDRPPGASDDAVAAAGHMSEALETLERARGHLYSFHQLIGEADFALDDVLPRLRAAGAEDLAAELERELVGRNVLEGRWTFQVVEEFDGLLVGLPRLRAPGPRRDDLRQAPRA